MRPQQNNKRIRGRNNGRKGPNPLTRSYESNGPDVKIRGTPQHIAEKYLQLARDAQSSGDTIMAESLLQHAEHYFRVIAAAQQPPPGFGGRPGVEAEADVDDDDDFVDIPDRFAPLSERLPQPAFQPQPQPQPYQAQPQPSAHFAAPQPQPQPYAERPYGERNDRPNDRQNDRRPDRGERPPFQNRDRMRDRPERVERNDERPVESGGERPPRREFDRNRDNRRFPPRVDPSMEEQPGGAPTGLPAFITAPTRVIVPDESPAEPFVAQDRGAQQDHEGGVGYHLSSRRRRRPRPPMDGEPQSDEAPQTGELPLGE
jgi:hypothetical protein